MFRGTGEPGQITVLSGTCQKKLSYGFNPPECEQIPVMILLVIRHKICYHTRVKSEGESGVSRHSPDPRNRRGPAWSASNSQEYTGHTRGSQYPSGGMLLPIAGFAPVGHAAGKERTHEAILLRGA